MQARQHTFLNVIPDEHRELAQEFFAESKQSFQTIVQASGAIYLLSLLLIGMVAGDPYLNFPELVFLDALNILIGIAWVSFSHKIDTMASLYAFLFWGMVILLYTNMRESMILQNYMSLFLITLCGAFVSAILSWPTIWTVRIQVLVALSTLSMFFYWDSNLIGPMFTIILMSLLSVVIHVLITRQRWEGFLNRHCIETLNADLQHANRQLQEHSQRLEHELALARHIQQGLLPPSCPTWSHLDVVCYTQPALEIGGDFYSYHTFTNGSVVVAVGDVSGKGAAAALLMAASLSLFSSTLTHNLTPVERLARLDTDLVPYTSSRRQNCALCYVQLDRNTLAIVNAGGIPPYIRRQNGHVEWPSVCGFALGQGLGAQVGYQETSVVLNNGDLVVLTSDGVVEAANSHGEMFGFERLQEAIANGPLDTAQEMLNHLLQTVADFVNGINPHDDMTIVVFRLIR